MKKKRKHIFLAWVFLMPGLSGITVFMVLPFLDVVRRSFLDAMGREFAGLENYEMVWKNGAFRLAAGNTMLFLAFAIPVLFVMSLVLSLLVFKAEKGILKTSLILPMVIPAAAMVLVWKILLCTDGVLNQILSAMTGKSWETDWVNENTSFAVLVVTYVWKNTGYDMLLWLAGLSSIPESLYDAAQMDGAGWVARLFYITMPCLKNTAGLVVILSVVNSFRVYREAYLLAGSYPNQRIYMVPHLFGHWFLTMDIQKMSTAAVFLVLGAVIGAGACKGIGRIMR